MSELRRVCVFCGSKHGRQTGYTVAARKVGRVLAERGVTLVYGGGDVGLMGVLADEVLAGGGEVIGVIHEFMVDHEFAHYGLSVLEVVPSMHARKARMAELADGFIALPGGWGTLEEVLEIVTWAQLQLHDKPVGLLDVGDFYSGLLEFLDHAVVEGFIKEKHRGLLLADDDLDRLLDRMAAHVPTGGTKWAGDDRT